MIETKKEITKESILEEIDKTGSWVYLPDYWDDDIDDLILVLELEDVIENKTAKVFNGEYIYTRKVVKV